MTTIEASVIAELIRQEFPEFALIVDEHVADWADEPMIYLLLGDIFRSLLAVPAGRDRLPLAARFYAFVDRMLSQGSKYVQDAFAIEFVEPLSDAKSDETYPNLEAAMGPEARRVLAEMREWWRCYSAMMQVVQQLNREIKAELFTSVGIDEDHESLRVIADPETWYSLSSDRRRYLSRHLHDEWEAISGHKNAVEITGPRTSNFPVLSDGHPSWPAG